jgi:hypothetical protein
MTFVKGQSGNPSGRPKARPFRDALNMQIAEAGEDHKALRRIALALLDKAASGDVQAIKEVADRLDGKVPQGLIGGDDDDAPIKVQSIERLIVDPANSNS